MSFIDAASSGALKRGKEASNSPILFLFIEECKACVSIIQYEQPSYDHID